MRSLRRARRAVRPKPYPATYERAVDPADKFGLQEVLGAGSFQVCYLRGTVSFQKGKRIPPEVKEGRIPRSEIILRRRSPVEVEYKVGTPRPEDSMYWSQSELMDDLAEGLGLDKQQAINVSIKERVLLQKTRDLPKQLLENELLCASEDLYHYQRAAGDFTEIVARSLKIPHGYFMSLRKLIRNELARRGIVRRDDPILTRIRSVLRTITVWSDATTTRELLPLIGDIHDSLTRPYWWQDVAIPHRVIIDEGITPLPAMMYSLHKRGFITVIQLPRGSY